MRTRLITIVLLVFLAAPASDGFTPLTLGAAPGATAGLQTGEQAANLATELGSALGEEVQLRLFTEQAELGRWLQQSTVPALAVVDGEYLGMHRHEFALLGPAEPDGPLQIVAGPGMGAELQQRVMTVLVGKVLPPSAVAPQLVTAVPAPANGSAPSTVPVKGGQTAGPEVPEPLPVAATPVPVEIAQPVMPPASEPATTDDPAAVEPSLATPGGEVPGAVAVEVPPEAHTVAESQSGSSASLAERHIEGPAAEAPPVLEDAAASPEPSAVVPSTEPAPTATVAAPPAVGDPRAPPMPEPSAPASIEPLVAEPPGAAPAPAIAGDAVAEQPSSAMTVTVELPPGSSASLAERHTEAPAAEAPPVLEDAAASPEPSAADPSTESAPSVTAAASPAVGAPRAPTVPEPSAPASIEPLVAEPPGVAPPTAIAGEAVAEQPSSAMTVTGEPPSVPPLGGDELATSALPATESGTIAPAAAPVAAGAVPEPPETSATPAAAVPEPVPPVEPRGMEAGADLTPVPVQVIEPLQPVAVAPPPDLVPMAQGETAIPEVAAPATEATPETTVVSAESQEAAVALALPGGVPEIIAQPDLPYELRPMGVPVPRPTAPAKAADVVEEPALLGTFQSLLAKTPTPEPLIPPPDPDPGVVYVIPFISLMVPREVEERVFDGFVDILNQRGQGQKLKFVILKQALGKIDRKWLAARKHVMGEIFGYVEDSGCCSTTLRAHARLTYYRANQAEPALKFDYPIQAFFDHDRSNLTVEREKLADQIVSAMVGELFKTLQR